MCDMYNLNDNLYHHGIKGQKWGVRRFQNEDGKLTDVGKKKYAKKISKLENKINKQFQKEANLDVRKIVAAKRASEWNERNPKLAAKRDKKLKENLKARERFEKRNQKLADREAKIYQKNQDKTIKLLDKAGKMGLNRTLIPTIRTGEAYFVDSVASLGGYYIENGTTYRMNVESAKVRLD